MRYENKKKWTVVLGMTVLLALSIGCEDIETPNDETTETKQATQTAPSNLDETQDEYMYMASSRDANTDTDYNDYEQTDPKDSCEFDGALYFDGESPDDATHLECQVNDGAGEWVEFSDDDGQACDVNSDCPTPESTDDIVIDDAVTASQAKLDMYHALSTWDKEWATHPAGLLDNPVANGSKKDGDDPIF